MGTILNIRNPRAHELAKELAERRKTGITEVVIQALEHELERERATIPLRIPTKPAGDSDLKPAVVPRRSRPPFRSEAGRWRRRSRGSEVKITGSVQQVKR